MRKQYYNLYMGAINDDIIDRMDDFGVELTKLREGNKLTEIH